MGTLYLIRGLPGAGKSTLANRLATAVFEADHYFIGPDGVYRFDASQLPAAHADCQAKTAQAMKRCWPNIAVANTFTRRWELAPYYALAKEHEYTVIEITLTGTPFPSVHAVPTERLLDMAARWER